MSTVKISDLRAAKNGEELVDKLDQAGIALSVLDDVRLNAALKNDFASKRRTLVRLLESEGLVKTDGNVDDTVVAQPARVNQWFTKVMTELDAPAPTDAKESELVEERPSVGRKTKTAGSFDNWAHAALGGGLITEVIAEMGASRLDDMLTGGGNRTNRRPAIEVADTLEGEAIAVGRVSKSLGSRIMSGFGAVLVAGIALLGIVALFTIGLIIFWPITIPFIFACWYVYRWLDRRAHINMLRWVGEDLPTVLRLSRVSWTEFCDPAQPEKWDKVYQRAMKHLDSKLPWHNSREDRIDNLLFELTARINKFYRDAGKTEAETAAIMNAADTRIPEAVYRLDLSDGSGSSSLISRYLEYLKSA